MKELKTLWEKEKMLVNSYHFLFFTQCFPKPSSSGLFNPFPKQQIIDSSKLYDFADNNFKSDENGRKLSYRLENTVGKGEIACYEQFLLFPQCFQKTCTADT